MMDASGLKFGSLTSQHNRIFRNFTGQNSGQSRGGGASHAAAPGTDGTDETKLKSVLNNQKFDKYASLVFGGF